MIAIASILVAMASNLIKLPRPSQDNSFLSSQSIVQIDSFRDVLNLVLLAADVDRNSSQLILLVTGFWPDDGVVSEVSCLG